MPRDRKPSRQTSVVLAALMERPRTWRHGYDLSRSTRLKSGTLYPILMRLTDRNLLASKWQPAEQAGRPPRHMYRLTTHGVTYAKELWSRYPMTTC
jgi:PadR family transcriptional regulator, regulatory protein PadR